MAISAIDTFILEQGVIGFYQEPITLKSGRESYFYINWRRACADAFLLDQLTDLLAENLRQIAPPFDCLVGIPEGGTKLAIITALKLAKSSAKFEPGSQIIAMGRSQAKSHGDPDDRYFLGAPQGRILLIEDTATTGISLISYASDLRRWGYQVIGAISLADRNQTRRDGLSVEQATRSQLGADFFYGSLSSGIHLIQLWQQRYGLEKTLAEKLQEEFAKWGSAPLVLPHPQNSANK